MKMGVWIQMNINWSRIIDGFNGFEKLAVEFVKENEPRRGCEWKHTKNTRDGNHDAILSKEFSKQIKPEFAIFVGYADNADIWWMEAKYSSDLNSKNKVISRYRLDATIVSAILSCSVSKIVSGIGKSYVLQLFKNRLMTEKCNILCDAYVFSGDNIQDIKVLKKIVFHLFLPYLSFEDLDSDYVHELQNQFSKLKNTFWDFVFSLTEIEDFIRFTQNPKLLEDVFLNNICMNNRIIILDDIDKLSKEFKHLLEEILKLLIIHEYPIFCIITSHRRIPMENYRSGKKQFLKSIELNVTSNDICTLFNTQNINIEQNSVITLFGSVIEVLYFMKYLTILNNNIKIFSIAYIGIRLHLSQIRARISTYFLLFVPVNGRNKFSSTSSKMFTFSLLPTNI